MRVEFSLLCDDKACTRQVGATAREEDTAKSLVFERAREAGWDVDGVGHWCPQHVQVNA